MELQPPKKPKDKTNKNILLEVVSEFSQVSGYKMNVYESTVFLHNSSEQSENKIKETISFAISLKRIKHLGINLI